MTSSQNDYNTYLQKGSTFDFFYDKISPGRMLFQMITNYDIKKESTEEVTFNAMVGGISPTILSELSGLYEPFYNAIKELVTNSYDAKASEVEIKLSDDFSFIEIIDNGQGMTPFDLLHKYLRIGVFEKTTAENDKIGGKGIGFLAPARYCKKVVITTKTNKILDIALTIHNNKLILNKLTSQLGWPLPITLLAHIGTFKLNGQAYISYKVSGNSIVFPVLPSKANLSFQIDLSKVIISAEINFEHLLSLHESINLLTQKDFCSLHIKKAPQLQYNKTFTRIKLDGLNLNAINSLKHSNKSGFVRNIQSKNGLEQFVWHLSRAIPVDVELPENIPTGIKEIILSNKQFIEKVSLKIAGKSQILKRPIYSSNIYNGYWNPIEINTDKLKASGFLYGNESVIYPAELRGITIRVNNTAIGPPNFFGMEYILSGASKAALNHITGEINIVKGMDALNTINPGREGFYEDSLEYRELKKVVVGQGEGLGGKLREVVSFILKYVETRAAIEQFIKRAESFRKSLLDFSMAINNYSIDIPQLKKVISIKNKSNALFLKDTPDVFITSNRLHNGFKIMFENIKQQFEIDFDDKKVIIDSNHDAWNQLIFVVGEYFEVVYKDGKLYPDILSEIDNLEKKIYINWGNPIRQLMDDKVYIKSALSWIFAKEASENDQNLFTKIFLSLLSYQSN